MAQNNPYMEIIKDTAKMLCLAKEKGVNTNSRQIAELYGIYYNAFAGAIRAGAMYSKEMDVDGYPKFVIPIGNTMYPCRDIALRDILGDEYEKLTKYPYEDTSLSYVRHYTPSVHISDEYGTPGISQNAAANNEGKDSQRTVQKKEEALLRAKNRELLKDARGFQYDPNYDHFYSDRLPSILRELDSKRIKTAARITFISITCAGILLTLAML